MPDSHCFRGRWRSWHFFLCRIAHPDGQERGQVIAATEWKYGLEKRCAERDDLVASYSPFRFSGTGNRNDR